LWDVLWGTWRVKSGVHESNSEVRGVKDGTSGIVMSDSITELEIPTTNRMKVLTFKELYNLAITTVFCNAFYIRTEYSSLDGRYLVRASKDLHSNETLCDCASGVLIIYIR
jgi:hypothetical protein